MALSAISMNSALAQATCEYMYQQTEYTNTINQFFTQSVNHFYINNNETSLRDETISRYLFKEGVL